MNVGSFSLPIPLRPQETLTSVKIARCIHSYHHFHAPMPLIGDDPAFTASKQLMLRYLRPTPKAQALQQRE
jgi:hypothetical protein